MAWSLGLWISWTEGVSNLVSRLELWKDFCSFRAASLISLCFIQWNISCGFCVYLSLLTSQATKGSGSFCFIALLNA